MRTMNRSYRYLLLAAVLCALLMPLAAAGCSSKAEEDDDGGDPLACSLNTSFVGRTHASGTVILQASSLSCGEIQLDVLFTGISNIFTVGFDVTYPTGMLSYDSYQTGPLLLQGSPTLTPFFSVSESSPGRIQVFATRFSPAPSVDAPGDSVLMTLVFRANSPGEGAIVFDLASSPVQEQVLDEAGNTVTATFTNGSNLARVF